MRKPSFQKQFLITAPAVIILFILLCNSGCTSNTPSAPPAGTVRLSGYLDTLWADSATFAKIDTTKRMVFEFRIGGADSLTMDDSLAMDGWTAPKKFTDNFNNTPDINLLIGRTDSSATLVPGTYLGNQVLHKGQLKTIQDLLASNHAHFVLFAPNKDKNHVYYTIFLGYDDPRERPLIPFTTPPVGTGESANPSPPKNYSDTQ